MSAARRRQKRLGSRKRLWPVLAVALAIATTVPVAACGATADWVVTDAQTGLAIGGFDPVAYFTDSAPKLGRPEIERSQAGAVWRFRNEGNRAAFTERPDVYMPRFGGYDPVAIARGTSVPGHPSFWLVHEQRLYLFYSAKERALFAAEPARIIDAAARKWPEVQRTLAH